MTTKDLLVFVLIFAAAGFSIYRKYMKKKGPQGDKKSTDIPSGPTSKDDEYEPYGKR